MENIRGLAILLLLLEIDLPIINQLQYFYNPNLLKHMRKSLKTIFWLLLFS